MSDSAVETEDGGRRRRALALLLLFLLVLVGGGIGTFVLEEDPDTAPGLQTPTETQTPASTAATTGTVSLTADSGTRLLQVEDAVPGDSGVSRLTLRNSGDRAGELAIANLTIADRENGIVGPESSVDDSSDQGELADNLLVRLSVEYPDGETVRVFGGDDYVTLANIDAQNRSIGDLEPDERVTVVFEWQLPTDVGNEVQSDIASFDIVFGLRGPSGETPDQ